MKRGFTLVELLAVIVILAIILVIAVPGISGIIESTQVSAFKSDEQLLAKVAKTYTSINSNYLPTNVGETKEITLNELQSNNFISEIKDPKNKSNLCNGYVLITKLDDGNYSYNPFLNCTSNIGNSTDDGLLAYYPFDDLQESTTNLAPSPRQIGSNYNSLQSNVEFNSVIAPNGLMEGTKLIATVNSQARTEFNLTLPATDTYYTFSVYAKRGSTPYASLYTYFDPYVSPCIIVNLDTGEITHNVNTISTSLEKVSDDWWRISMTVLVKPDQIHSIFKLIQTSSSSDPEGGTIGDYVYYWGAQLEKKDHLTPFTDSTRLSVVKDYSLNSNNATLLLDTTPSWTKNSIIGKGAYSFDGIDDNINFGAVSENILRQGMEANDFTLSAWIMTTNNQDGASRIIIARAGWHDGLQIKDTGQVFFGIFDENGSHRAINSQILAKNVNHYVVATYSSRIMSLYVDGVLVGTNNYFNVNPTVKFRVNTSPFTSGATSDGSVHQYRGIIDDVRIYSRALNTEEIKNNYNALK